ncbi:L-aminopeptidase/D-esterase-like protein [Roseovarius sp. MBR-51]
MFQVIRFFSQGVFASLLVILVATSSVANAAPRIPVLEQRKAILDCRYEMGFRGQARFGATWSELPPGGSTISWIVPGSNLSPAQADRINECADQRLGRASTPRFATQAQRQSVRVRGSCPSHAPVLFGGSTYCLRGN